MNEQKNIFEYSSDPKTGFYLVGLVDILGQKQKLYNIDKISVNSPQEFGNQFIQNIRAIQRLRKAFQSTRESFISQRKNKISNGALTGIQ